VFGAKRSLIAHGCDPVAPLVVPGLSQFIDAILGTSDERMLAGGQINDVPDAGGVGLEIRALHAISNGAGTENF
jgi:hypothetical protein